MTRGHIRPRGSGSFQITVSDGFDPVTGKRRQLWRTVHGTRRQAERELTRMLAEVDTGTAPSSGRMTLADLLDTWLDAIRNQVRPRTYQGYESIVRLHLKPGLGRLRLAQLRPLDIERFEQAKVGARGPSGRLLSAQTVLHHHAVLIEALAYAVRLRLLPSNPALGVRPPKASRYKFAVLDVDDVQTILSAAENTELEALLIVAVATGARRGELLGLRWADVDLEAGVLRISRSLQVAPSGLTFQEPKTESSRRSIALPLIALNALRAHRARQAQRRLAAGTSWQEDGVVFDRGDGAPMHPDRLTAAFRRLVRACDLGTVRFHDLRHANATLSLLAGVPAKVVQERLGHASVSTTMDIYAAVLPSMDREAADALDVVLRKRSAIPKSG